MDQGNGAEVEWINDLVASIRQVHDELLKIGGGRSGERTASLLAACARPYQTFDGQFLHEDPYHRAAAIFHGIICDHVFVDGNKRTGTIAAIFVLASEDCLPDHNEYGHLRLTLLGEVALETAQGRLSVSEVAFWIRRIFEP